MSMQESKALQAVARQSPWKLIQGRVFQEDVPGTAYIAIISNAAMVATVRFGSAEVTLDMLATSAHLGGVFFTTFIDHLSNRFSACLQTHPESVETP